MKIICNCGNTSNFKSIDPSDWGDPDDVRPGYTLVKDTKGFDIDSQYGTCYLKCLICGKSVAIST